MSFVQTHLCMCVKTTRFYPNETSAWSEAEEAALKGCLHNKLLASKISMRIQPQSTRKTLFPSPSFFSSTIAVSSPFLHVLPSPFQWEESCRGRQNLRNSWKHISERRLMVLEGLNFYHADSPRTAPLHKLADCRWERCVAPLHLQTCN